MERKWIILIAVLVILGFFAVAFYINGGIVGSVINEGVACPTDVKDCSDGSHVSRNSDLNCEFDACPSESGESCLSFGEEECLSNWCEAVYLYPGCRDNDANCDGTPIFQECLSKG